MRSSSPWSGRGSAAGYSARKVVAGSIRAARQAGTAHARMATVSINTTTTAYVTGSRRETPNRSDTRARLAGIAPISPMTMPIWPKVK